MRRLAIIAHYDKDGELGGYVEHFVDALRPFVERVVLVSNGELSPAASETAARIADRVLVRDNSGYDVYAYRDGIWAERDRTGEFDELLLLNTTFYAPVHDFAPSFDAVADPDIDFWGLTEHPEVDPHPYHRSGVMPRHIQSYWIGVRQRMLASKAWDDYWTDMPEIRGYDDAVIHNETRFTEYFEAAGFRSQAVFPASTFPVENATMEAPDLLLDAGCPIVKRRLFFHDPIHFEQHALIGRGVRERMERSGYPMELVWQDLARVARPRDVQSNAGMLEILPDVDAGGAALTGIRVGVLAHIFYEDMTAELLDLADRLPVDYTLIATTPTREKAEAIKAVLATRGRTGDEVRVVESNRGRDISAFLLGCGDVLRSDRFDVIVKVHTKKSPQAHFNQARIFRDHLFGNLFSSPGYAANLLRLFAQHPSLGMVFPAMIHIGYPTLGRAWLSNREPAEELAESLGIAVPFDDLSPVAPYGSMFFARPEALRKLAAAPWRWEDFPDEGEYADGALTHVLERLFAYAAIDEGYHVRTVLNTSLAASSHTALEYKLQEALASLPGELPDQLRYARAIGGTLAAPRSVLMRARLLGRRVVGRNHTTAIIAFRVLNSVRDARRRVSQRRIGRGA
ncbi:rhamnan synthesis F family protein [Agrococcus lahaulensis]|uniref:rhamnan synthesis F family protein n=1 Tax=Agrococcus lahaulensis TaxID=341722 RepID=UPI0004191726|nr:rhamnan synthesis F family protein [Agrococcus lahaulensis]